MSKIAMSVLTWTCPYYQIFERHGNSQSFTTNFINVFDLYNHKRPVNESKDNKKKTNLNMKWYINLLTIKRNKTSIRCTLDVKFISATTKKILVKNDFWTTKSKKISKKIFFSKFFFQKIFREIYFDYVVQKSFLTKILLVVAEMNLTSGFIVYLSCLIRKITSL